MATFFWAKVSNVKDIKGNQPGAERYPSGSLSPSLILLKYSLIANYRSLIFSKISLFRCLGNLLSRPQDLGHLL
jgi:hypothetical protein